MLQPEVVERFRVETNVGLGRVFENIKPGSDEKDKDRKEGEGFDICFIKTTKEGRTKLIVKRRNRDGI